MSHIAQVWQEYSTLKCLCYDKMLENRSDKRLLAVAFGTFDNCDSLRLVQTVFCAGQSSNHLDHLLCPRFAHRLISFLCLSLLKQKLWVAEQTMLCETLVAPFILRNCVKYDRLALVLRVRAIADQFEHFNFVLLVFIQVYRTNSLLSLLESIADARAYEK